MTLKSLVKILLLGAVTLITACGGGGGSVDVASNTNDVTAEIGPQGGTLTISDGTQVVIPEGALTDVTTISIKKSSVGAPALPDNVLAGDIYEFTPHDVVFNQPVTIRIPVPAGATGDQMLFASPGGEWLVYTPSVVDGYAELQKSGFSWGLVPLPCPTQTTNTGSNVCRGGVLNLGPNPFTFRGRDLVDLSTVMTSESQTITGASAPVQISVTGGEYSIDGGAFTTVPGVVSNGQSVQVRHVSSSGYRTSTLTSLKVGSVVAQFESKTDWLRVQPYYDITFHTAVDVSWSTLVTSEEQYITEINAPVTLSVTGGEYSLDGGPFTSEPGPVTKGQRVRLRHTSSADSKATTQTILYTNWEGQSYQIGSFQSVTMMIHASPYIMSFLTVTDALLSTTVTSEVGYIGGINVEVPISVTGGEYSIDGGPFTSAPGVVTNGQRVRLRHTTSADSQATTTTTLYSNWGGASHQIGQFQSITRMVHATPYDMNYLPVGNVQLSTQITSGVEYIRGIDVEVPIYVVGGEYSINDGPFTSAPGVVTNGQRVRLRHISSPDFQTETRTYLYSNYNGSSHRFGWFATLTVARDETPDTFAFTLGGFSGVPLSTLVESYSSQITGINVPVAISVTGGEYSIDGGAFTSAPGTVVELQRVRVRHTSGSAPLQTVTTILTVGTISVPFTSQTLQNYYSIGGSVSGLTGTGLVLQNNGADNLAISANGLFSFSNTVADNTAYSVSILNQPSGQTCSLQNLSGTALADVTNVLVNCVTNIYTIGGNVSGLNGTGLVLQNNGSNLAISSSGAFTFVNTVDGNATYNVSILSQPSGQICTLQNASGTALANVSNVTVNCVDNSGITLIGNPVTVTSSNAVEMPSVAMDKGANAFAVWYQHDGVRWNVYANRYAAGSGWGTPVAIETETGVVDMSTAPGIAVDDSGNAIAVWSQQDSTLTVSTWANRYVAGIGWSGAVLIEANDAGSALNPHVAMNASGDAVAVWKQSDSAIPVSHYGIWANRYTVGSGWGTPEMIDNQVSTNSGHASDPRVVMDNAGNAVTIWRENNGTYLDVLANRYVAGSGWSAAETIESNTPSAAEIDIAMNRSSGNARAVWRQDFTSMQIWTNAMSSSGVWGTAEQVNAGSSWDAFSPRVVVNAYGESVVVWSELGADSQVIVARRYNGNAWLPMMAVSSPDNMGSASDPALVINQHDEVVVVWKQFDGIRSSMFTSKYTLWLESWSAISLLENIDTTDSRSPVLSGNAFGTVMAVWNFEDGTLWSNYFGRIE